MIVETLIEMQGCFYPFDESISHGSKGMVEQLQRFDSKEQLIQRKNELKKHIKGIQSNFIIKLLKIFEEDLCLHYIFEHVPYSLSTYIKNQLEEDEYDQFKDMAAKLLFKKIINDINAATAQLSKLRIEAELLYQNLGVQGNKLKLFIGTRFYVGRKSELLLKEHYKPRKELIFKVLEQQFLRIICQAHESPNFVINGNRLLFNNNKRQNSIPYSKFASSVYSDSIQNSFCLNDTYVNCDTKDTNMNNTKEKQRRYSQTKWNTIDCKNYDKDQKKLRNTQSPVFVNKFNIDSKSKMGQSRHFDDSINSQDENFDGKSYCHSKSIRIQLEKNKNRRQRKDSYKVKIITTHQYQMDDINPKDIFQKCNISNSESSKSNRHRKKNKQNSPHKKDLEDKVQKAAQKARYILNGYLHRRRQSRK